MAIGAIWARKWSPRSKHQLVLAIHTHYRARNFTEHRCPWLTSCHAHDRSPACQITMMITSVVLVHMLTTRSEFLSFSDVV